MHGLACNNEELLKNLLIFKADVSKTSKVSALVHVEVMQNQNIKHLKISRYIFARWWATIHLEVIVFHQKAIEQKYRMGKRLQEDRRKVNMFVMTAYHELAEEGSQQMS